MLLVLSSEDDGVTGFTAVVGADFIRSTTGSFEDTTPSISNDNLSSSALVKLHIFNAEVSIFHDQRFLTPTCRRVRFFRDTYQYILSKFGRRR